MSYGSKVCPTCHGEVRVYFERGEYMGTCPECGTIIDGKVAPFIERIPDEGAFYEVVYEEYATNPAGFRVCTMRSSLGIFTDREQAKTKMLEVRATDPWAKKVGAGIKKWNHDRTECQWIYRPGEIEARFAYPQEAVE